MTISLYDNEEVIPTPVVEETKKEEKPKVVSKVKNAKAPPTMGEAFQTFLGDIGAKPVANAVSGVGSEIKDYLTNPIQYNPNGAQDYTNIDWNATLPRLAADVTALYAGGKGIQYGVNQLFPSAGVKQQKDELAFRKQELKRQMEGNLTPQEQAHINLQNAKTQQILSSLNPVAPQAPTAPQAPAVPQPTQTTVAPPTVQQRNIVPPVSEAEQVAAEAEAMKPGSLMGHVQQKYNVTPTTQQELLMFANQATPSMKANFAPALIDMMNQGVIPKSAADAGVTPSTSLAEAQTEVTSHEAALTPAEKAQQVAEVKSTTEPAKPKRPEFVGPIKPVEIPEGRIPNYMEYKMKKGQREYINKKDQDVIGKGAYNWLQGQWGPEKTQQIYEEAFGKKNVTYEEMRKAIKEGKLPVPPKNELGHGGSFPREPHVPEYIRGNVNPALLNHMLYGGLAGLAALHEGKNAKEAYQRGDTGMALSHLSQLGNLTLPGMIANQLFGLSPEELQTLRSAEQGRKVGGGRGIAPPSDYR